MRKILLLSTLIILFTSCSVKEKPEFIKVEKIEVVAASAEFITLNVNAVFNNPNNLKGTLNCENIMILINGIECGKISSEDFKVPAQRDFFIPLKITMYTEAIFKKNSKGVIGSLLNSILGKPLSIQYKGDIVYSYLGFSFKYPIDIKENVKLKI